MTPVSPLRRVLWLIAIAVVAIALTTAVLVHGPAAPRTGAPAASGPAAGTAEGVVCFGVVDLEQGVTSLAPLQPGRVVEVAARENQHVSEGTLLLRLDDSAARSRLAEAEAAVEAAQLQAKQARKLPDQHRGKVKLQKVAIEVARHRLAAARLGLAHKQKLAKSNLADALEVSASEELVRELEALERGEVQRLTDLEAQDVQIDVQRADKELAAAQARHEQARLAVEDCRLKAPRPGVMLRCLVAPGDLLTPQSGQPAVLFASDGPLIVRAEVEQEFARRIKEGEAARVQDEADATATWRGKVERIGGWYNQRRAILHQPSELNDVRTLECLIGLEPGQQALRLGQRVRVLIGPIP